MPDIHSHFTEYHASQYTNHATDVRFLGEQHFKIVTVYMVITGFIGNVAASHRSLLRRFRFIFSYLCLSWDKRTTQWWGVLFENLKQLEQLAHADGKMVESYSKYPRRPPGLFIRATLATEAIYYLGFAGWTIFLVYSWPVWWN
jgi:hypothetical protein